MSSGTRARVRKGRNITQRYDEGQSVETPARARATMKQIPEEEVAESVMVDLYSSKITHRPSIAARRLEWIKLDESTG